MSRRALPLLAAALLAALLAAPVAAQTPAAAPAPRPAYLDAPVEVRPAIPLRPSSAADTAGPSVTPYLPPAGRRSGAAVLVFPGGGYSHLSLDREGDQAARWLASLGVTAFVVRYRLGPEHRHPAMRDDGQAALRLVRERAAAWGVDPRRVGVLGFSAGGHLASTVATHFTDAATRPDLALLVYPVITMDGPHAHAGSRGRLLGEQPHPDTVRALSSEARVTRETPPTFLVASTDDAAVPVENALLLYAALRAHAVPVELHVFERGRHGFALAPADPVLAQWLTLAEAWLRRHGWLDRTT